MPKFFEMTHSNGHKVLVNAESITCVTWDAIHTGESGCLYMPDGTYEKLREFLDAKDLNDYGKDSVADRLEDDGK